MAAEKGVFRTISKREIHKAEEIVWNTTKGDIKIVSAHDIDIKTKNGVRLGDYEAVENKATKSDFDITFVRDKSEKTFVPLGILDFKNGYENPYFYFVYSLSGAEVDLLEFEIITEGGGVLYQIINLKPVVINASQKQNIKKEAMKKMPLWDPNKPVKTLDWQSMLNNISLAQKDYTKPGSYILCWDGFDNNGIYDSTLFNGKTLNAKIKVSKDGVTKTRELLFSTEYDEVNWVDVKIDRPNKKIDVTLRVDLKDGGANGLGKEPYKDPLDDPRMPSYRERYVWERLPPDILRPDRSIIKTRTRSFEELVILSLKGVNYHWGRNKKHPVGKGVEIDKEAYEVFVNAVNTGEKAMDDVDIVFNTNTYWGRSNNSGNVTGVKSFFANAAEYLPYVPLNETIFYNVGYVNTLYKYQSDLQFKRDRWIYLEGTSLYRNGETNVDRDFSYTSAHELGHSIIKAYAEGAGGSTDYSYKHKGSSDYSDRKPISEGGVSYPSNGEIDLMKYFNDDPKWYDFDRIIAEDKDVLGLIWLTKMKIK